MCQVSFEAPLSARTPTAFSFRSEARSGVRVTDGACDVLDESRMLVPPPGALPRLRSTARRNALRLRALCSSSVKTKAPPAVVDFAVQSRK